MPEADKVPSDVLLQQEKRIESSHYNLPTDYLLHENAVLRSKLILSEDHRLIEDIVSNQLQKFFGATIKSQSQQACSSYNATKPLSIVLQQLYEDKAELEAKLQHVQLDVSQRLNRRIDELEQERKELQARVQHYEMRANDLPTQPCEVELEQLRESEALLRQQLKSVEKENVSLVKNLKAIFTKQLALLPVHVEETEAKKVAFYELHTEQALLKAEIEEQQKRFQIILELREAKDEDMHFFYQQQSITLQQLLDAALKRECILLKEKTELERQLIAKEQHQTFQSESMHENLVLQEIEAKEHFASKRQRIEPNKHLPTEESMRMKYIRFWYEGHARLATLEQRIRDLESRETTVRVLQGRIAQLQRDRTNMTMRLVKVVDTLAQTRETNHQLRSQCTGLEVERDQLLRNLSTALGAAMEPGELLACSQAIREAASQQSPTTTSHATDFESLDQAMHQVRELKNEIAQLQRQKDNLLRYITVHEKRVAALLKREAMLSMKGHLSGAPKIEGEASSLSKYLELIDQSARDIFTLNERCTLENGRNFHFDSGKKGVSRYHESFLVIQKQLNESQEKLCDSYFKLHQSKIECEQLAASLTRSETEKSELLTSINEIASNLRNANMTIESLTRTLSRQQAENNSMIRLQQQTQAALVCVFDLYQAETAHVEGLRTLVQQGREDIIERVQREAHSWLSTENRGTDELSTQTAPNPHPNTFRSIVNALEHLNISVQESVSQVMLKNSLRSTRCLTTLKEIIKDQEERFSCLQRTYAESVTQLANSLSQRIINTQVEWKSHWKSKYLDLEQDYAKLCLNTLATETVYAKLEYMSLDMNSKALREESALLKCERDNMEPALTAIHAFLNKLKKNGNNSSFRKQALDSDLGHMSGKVAPFENTMQMIKLSEYSISNGENSCEEMVMEENV